MSSGVNVINLLVPTQLGYVLVGGIQLTSSTWWGFQYLQISAKDMAQNIIYSPGGGTKSP